MLKLGVLSECISCLWAMQHIRFTAMTHYTASCVTKQLVPAAKKVCKGVLHASNRTLVLPFTLIYMPFHNIMPFIALMVPQSTTPIPSAVKHSKTADAENDTRNSRERDKERENQEKTLCELFLLTSSFRKHKCTKQYPTCTVSADGFSMWKRHCHDLTEITWTSKYWGVATERPSIATQRALTGFLSRTLWNPELWATYLFVYFLIGQCMFWSQKVPRIL